MDQFKRGLITIRRVGGEACKSGTGGWASDAEDREGLYALLRGRWNPRPSQVTTAARGVGVRYEVHSEYFGSIKSICDSSYHLLLKDIHISIYVI